MEKQFILKENIKLTLISVSITIAVVGVLASLGYLSPDNSINRYMLYFMYAIPTIAFATLFLCYLQALKQIDIMSYAQVSVRILGLLILIGLTYYWKVPGFIISSIAVGIIGLIPLYFLSNRTFGDKPTIKLIVL